jgi:hypothetical protein
VAGAVIGGVAGGLAGKGVAESIDPTAEEAYWEANFQTRPYYSEGTSFEEYRPAYRYGIDARRRGAAQTFDEAETGLARDWEKSRGTSKLGWEKAKVATRDAWDRLERAMPGDADGDGR